MQKFNRVSKLGHKYTELANKNKIFSTVSDDADKNYDGASDRGCFMRVIGGASTRAILVHFNSARKNPFPFFGLPGIASYSQGCKLEMMLSPGQCHCVEMGL